MELKDIFTSKKYNTTHLSSEKVETPVVKKKNYKIINVEDNFGVLTDEEGTECGQIKIQEEFKEKINNIFEEDSQVNISVLIALGEVQIISCDRVK